MHGYCVKGVSSFVGLTMAPSSGLKVCQVCKEEPHKYVCPKCRLLYCSLPCYKEHSARCVSAFYESEFAAAAAAAAPTAHEQRAFSKTLTRIHQQHQQEEGEEDKAVKSLGLGSSDEEQALSDDAEGDEPQQQQQPQLDQQRLQQLQQLAAAGTLDLEHLTRKETKAFFAAAKIQLHGFTFGLRVELPVVEEPPHVCCRPTGPNPLLAMTLLQMLFAYAHCMRTFNGEVDELEVQEAAAHFLSVARGLELKDAPPASAIAAIDQTLQWAAQPPLSCTDSSFCEVCLSDASRLLSARDFALKATTEAAALVARFKHILMQQQHEQQQQQQREGEDVETLTPKQSGKLILKSERVLKKIGFIASAFYYHWQELLQQQQQPLLQALRQRAQLLQQLQQVKNKREDALKAARVLDSCGSARLAASRSTLKGDILIEVMPDSSSSSSGSSSSNSSSRVEEECLKREDAS
ncbi:hypothetical protein Esti_000165 [Eimeria stiedai]